jgi:hypothetical protein
MAAIPNCFFYPLLLFFMSQTQTFMSLMNDADNSIILTRMNEAPKELINEFQLCASRLAILEAEQRDQQKTHAILQRAFYELFDYCVELRTKMGYDTDIESLQYDWFEKAGLLE